MAGKVNYVPEGYHSVTPYLVVKNVNGLLDFVKQVFDAQEIERMVRPDGSINHAMVRIGDSLVMMSEPADANTSMPAMLNLYVPDADALYQRALEAGALPLREPADQFYGDRTAGVQDQFGNQWWISTHIEDVSKEELQRRARAQSDKA